MAYSYSPSPESVTEIVQLLVSSLAHLGDLNGRIGERAAPGMEVGQRACRGVLALIELSPIQH